MTVPDLNYHVSIWGREKNGKAKGTTESMEGKGKIEKHFLIQQFLLSLPSPAPAQIEGRSTKYLGSTLQMVAIFREMRLESGRLRGMFSLFTSLPQLY